MAEQNLSAKVIRSLLAYRRVDDLLGQIALREDRVEEGGDYFWTVKDNQMTLRTEIASAFDGEALMVEVSTMTLMPAAIALSTISVMFARRWHRARRH